jgi:4-amino-4-deoxy-L-arabinose transferase-like glycosyltransferase
VIRDLRGTVWPAAVAALLLLMAAIEWDTARRESQTYDEAVHMAAGYSYFLNGEYHIDPEHPPLSKMLAALPLLVMRPELPPEQPEWGEDHRFLGAAFLFRNRLPADTILLAGRVTRFAITLALGLALAVWSRARFGSGASLLALYLYTLDPNILAHGRYVTNDMLMALATFLALVAWSRFLSLRTIGALGLAGVALGMAMISKFSAVFLIPVFALLYLIRWWHDGDLPAGTRRLGWRDAAKSMAAVGVISLSIIALAYLPETARFLHHPGAGPPLTARIQPETTMGRVLYRVGQAFHLPAFTYLVGLESNERHDRNGHPSYLLGQIRERGGWWYYFPVAFALKAPDALLLLLVSALVLASLWMARPGLARRLRAAPFAWFVLTTPMAIYIALALRSHINVGVRHLLPVWPLLLIAVSAAAVHGLRRQPALLVAVVCMAAVVHATEAVAIYPHHLSFFNVLAGGPARGSRYLLDSNIDWGQDLKFLRRWQQDHGDPPICLAYFGTADAAYYRTKYYPWQLPQCSRWSVLTGKLSNPRA